MERVRIKIAGPDTDYATYTGFLWLMELKPLLEEEFQMKVEVEWEKRSDLEDYPILIVNEDKVFVGLPGEEFYLYEVLKGYLERTLSEKEKV